MLPEAGTPERKRLEEEALRIGLAALDAERGIIPRALYRTYEHYRTRYVEERGLMDQRPGGAEEWRDALTDARQLEALVNDTWARLIERGDVGLPQPTATLPIDFRP